MAFAAYDNFDRECVVAYPAVSSASLDELIMTGVLRNYIRVVQPTSWLLKIALDPSTGFWSLWLFSTGVVLVFITQLNRLTRFEGLFSADVGLVWKAGHEVGGWPARTLGFAGGVTRGSASGAVEVLPSAPGPASRTHRAAHGGQLPGHAGHSGSSDAGGETSHGGSERTTATHLLQGIANLDSKIEEAANAHPDFFIFKSLPGAGSALALCLNPGQPLSW
jgi:hypothetical protein